MADIHTLKINVSWFSTSTRSFIDGTEVWVLLECSRLFSMLCKCTVNNLAVEWLVGGLYWVLIAKGSRGRSIRCCHGPSCVDWGPFNSSKVNWLLKKVQVPLNVAYISRTTRILAFMNVIPQEHARSLNYCACVHQEERCAGFIPLLTYDFPEGYSTSNKVFFSYSHSTLSWILLWCWGLLRPQRLNFVGWLG